MADVARGEQFSALQMLCGVADKNAIHDDICTSGEILGDELMFGRHVGQEKKIFPGRANDFAFAQVGQGDEDIVARVEPQDFPLR